jgi:tRNA A-37 threonylcarbamoyl transferase component Bud32
MIHTLREHGFNTATPVACGQRGLSSFVLTLEIPGGIAADEFFEKLDGSQRRQFIERVADLTRRFHEAGFIHKDYYLSHIFVSRDQLYLIDLQRVLGPGKLHPRWQIKDLSQLAYTAQLAGASRTDLLRFYKRYADKMDWGFIRKVMARVAGLHVRGPKYDVIWDQPGARP